MHSKAELLHSPILYLRWRVARKSHFLWNASMSQVLFIRWEESLLSSADSQDSAIQSEWRNSDSEDQESAAKRPFDLLLEPSERTSFHSWHMERQYLCCVRCKGRFPCWTSVSWPQSGQKFTKSRHSVFFGTDNSLFENIDFERVRLITSMRNRALVQWLW